MSDAASARLPRGAALVMAAVCVFSCAREEAAASEETPPPARAEKTSGLARSDTPATVAADEARPVPTLQLVPATRDLTFLGVGERLSYTLELEGEVDPSSILVTTSCECLAARLVESADGKVRVQVDVTATQVEDIDGIVSVETAGRRVLARHVAKIDIRLRPFVQPREVWLAEGERYFDLLVGQAFGADDVDGTLHLADYSFSGEEKVFLHDLVGAASGFEFDYRVQREKLEFEVAESARTGPLDETVTILVGTDEPYQEFRVRVRRATSSPR